MCGRIRVDLRSWKGEFLTWLTVMCRGDGDYGVVLTFGCASCVVCIRALKKAEAAQVH